MTPAGMRPAVSSAPGQTGIFLDYDPGLCTDFPSGPEPIHGLYLSLRNAPAALIRLRARSYGSIVVERRFSLGPAGAWLSLAGWGSVAVEILSLGAPTGQVEAALLRQAPPSRSYLLLVEPLDSSGAQIPVPPGARRLTVSALPGGMNWSTSQTGGPPQTIPVALTVGQFESVAGTGYTNAAPGITACWEIEGL